MLWTTVCYSNLASHGAICTYIISSLEIKVLKKIAFNITLQVSFSKISSFLHRQKIMTNPKKNEIMKELSMNHESHIGYNAKKKIHVQLQWEDWQWKKTKKNLSILPMFTKRVIATKMAIPWISLHISWKVNLHSKKTASAIQGTNALW